MPRFLFCEIASALDTYREAQKSNHPRLEKKAFDAIQALLTLMPTTDGFAGIELSLDRSHSSKLVFHTLYRAVGEVRQAKHIVTVTPDFFSLVIHVTGLPKHQGAIRRAYYRALVKDIRDTTVPESFVSDALPAPPFQASVQVMSASA